MLMEGRITVFMGGWRRNLCWFSPPHAQNLTTMSAKIRDNDIEAVDEAGKTHSDSRLKDVKRFTQLRQG